MMITTRNINTTPHMTAATTTTTTMPKFFTTHKAPSFFNPTTESIRVQFCAPAYQQSKRQFATQLSEESQKKFKRLLYQAEQRGWLELDLIFGGYIQKNKERLQTEENMAELSAVCDLENADLIHWFVERRPIPQELESNKILKEMLDYAYDPHKPWFPTSQKFDNQKSMVAGNQ